MHRYHVQHDNIYQRIAQHVANVHVDTIVQDDHGLRVLQLINERMNVERESGALLDLLAVVI